MASIHFEAELDAQKLYHELSKIEQQMGRMADSSISEAQRMDATFRKLGGLLATYFSFAAGKQFVTELVAVRGEFQQLEISLQTILKDKALADKLMADVVEFAAYTPFELTEVGQGVKKLLAFNVEAEDSLDILRRLGDVASGLSTDLGGLVQAYGKVKAKGKLQAEEMNLFLERGVPLVSALAEKYGVAESAIYDMASKSQIHFEDLHEVIVNLTDDGGMFANMMEKQVEALPGQISNLKDAVAQMLDKIGQANEGILYGGIGAAKSLVENYDLVLIALKTLIAGYGTYKTATILTSIVKQAQAAGSLAKALKGAAIAQKALNLAQKASPIGLAVAAVVALVAGMTALAKRTREAEEEAGRFVETYKGIGEGVQSNYSSEFLVLDILKKKLDEVKGSREEEQTIIKTINEKYGNHLDSLLGETAAYGDLKLAIDEVISSLEKQMEIDILMEKARAVKQEAMASQALYEEYITPNLQEGYHRDELLKLSKEAKEILKEEFGVKLLPKETLSAFGLLKTKLEEEGGEYTAELERLMGEIKAIEMGLYSGDDDPDEVGFDSKKFTKSIKASKKAFEEWEQFKETSRADELQGDYQHYLDLGENYKEYLETKLKEYQGNHAAVMILTKELAAIESKEIEVLKEEAEELKEHMDDLWDDTLADMDKVIDQEMAKMEKENTASLKKFQKEIFDGMKGIAQIAARYASPKEILHAQLKEIENHYKKARLPLDEEYYKLREDITKEYLANEILYFTRGAKDIFSELSNLVGNFDSEMASAMNSMGSLVANAGTAAAGFLSGDIMSAIPATIGAIGSIIDLFSNKAPESHAVKISKAEQAYQDLNKQMDITNRLLDDQFDLLSRLSGEEWLSGAVDTTKMLNDALTETVSQLYLTINAGKTIFSEDYVFAIGWDVEDFQTYIDENLTGEEADKLQAIIDQYKALEDQIRDLGETIQENLTGTTADAIGDSLVQAFSEGEYAAENFTKTFEKLMKQAILESFKKQFIDSQMQGFYDAFAVASEDGLAPGEITNLQDIWEAIIQDAQAGWEALQNNFDFLNESAAKDTEDPNSLSGAIRRELTEETGSLLAGYINSMRLDVREGIDIQRDMFGVMGNIEYNTFLTADRLGALGDIRADIREIRTQLTA